jgi:mRNA-degrading endonuclease RelE of RelBE toxin-antitoxin system
VGFDLVFSTSFERRFKKENRSNQLVIKETVELFKKNPYHPSLNFESITNQKGFYSIRIDRKIRIRLYVQFDDVGKILQVDVIDFGNHDTVYRAR